jgi:exopolysaccharide biosynthesis predicted pyruvyltransferase EpsI
MADQAGALTRDMQDFLQNFAGEQVLLLPNQGNAGDCLIFVGTLIAMRKAGIDVEVAGDDADMSGRTVFLGGGGNLVGVYTGTRNSLQIALRSRARRVVLLPHTVRANADLIAQLDERFTIWCREGKSFAHVRRVNPKLDCRLGHDMAFHCDVVRFMAEPDVADQGPRVLEAYLNRANASLDRLRHRAVVHFMRTDKEARQTRFIGDLDVSNVFGRVADEASSRLSAWCFLKTIANANRIVTDRLHVSIASALLHKNCELLDNSYSKNRDIYAHSLGGFPWITLADERAASPPDEPPVKRSLHARLMRHARRFLQGRGVGRREDA